MELPSKSEQIERADRFDHEVNTALSKNTFTFGRNLRYYHASASKFYPNKPWNKALQMIESDSNFDVLRNIIERLKEGLQSNTDSDTLISQLNNILESKNVVFLSVNPNPSGKPISTNFKGKSYEVHNHITTTYSNGAHQDLARTQYLPPYTGDDDPDPEINYYFSLPKEDGSDSPAVIQINESLIRTNPQRASVTIAHELGHCLEGRTQQKVIQDQSLRRSGFAPDTEVISSLCGLYASRELYLSTGEAAFLDSSIEQSAVYTQVVGGNINYKYR